MLIGENVLNFHADEDCYYEEWGEDIAPQGGWIVGLNFNDHVLEEMKGIGIDRFVHLNGPFRHLEWRKLKPDQLCDYVESLLTSVTD